MRRSSPLLALLALLALGSALSLGTGPARAAKDPHPKHLAQRVHHAAKKIHTTATGTGATTGGGSGATATQGAAVINDCQDHGQLTRHWSKAELREALSVMSAATKQYSNCQSVIQSALAHGVNTGDSGGGGGGGSGTTTIVIIVVVVVALLAVIFGGLAIRRRRAGGGPGSGPGGTVPASESPTRVRPPDA